ncbi:hypothetical protein L6164_014578 [Bauhinia variegata]|uniref:Uncharacterized protein n=1 Tax=Bauhinia variegata TaxID=167791 RepID=A0ACB9NJA6_BAUVA|nr:hypothetical protein L6164_014578 [Bauhinia variegata]
MAMAKLVCVLLLALLGISVVMGKEGGRYQLDSVSFHSSLHTYMHAYSLSVQGSAREDVVKRSTTNHACSSAKSAVPSVSAFLLASTAPCYNNWKTRRGGPKCP